MENNKIDIKAINERMTLLVHMLQTTMETTGIAVGFDLKEEKLVLKDIYSSAISRVDLGELNSILNKKK